MSPGTSISLTIIRQGTTKTLPVTLSPTPRQSRTTRPAIQDRPLTIAPKSRSSRGYVLTQRIRLGRHFGNAVFNDVADGNDSGKPATFDHGNMSKLSRRHPLHKIIDRITLFAGHDLACHHLFDGFVAKLTTTCNSGVVGKCTHNISFR